MEPERWVGRAVAARVEMAWTFEADHLVIGLDGPGQGWLCAGFHSQSSLAGARLVMAVREGDRVVAEEHVARPPAHLRLRALEGRPGASHRVEVRVPREGPGGEGFNLRSGARVHLTLAWSASPDFHHHSAQRDAVWTWL